ncbi:MAG: hypothetical protein QOH03_1111 [Kribbellaceae bacterium]|jgi:hypothetical protein|nr:hypothetical protein [Kribbellaceae bacterium]
MNKIFTVALLVSMAGFSATAAAGSASAATESLDTAQAWYIAEGPFGDRGSCQYVADNYYSPSDSPGCLVDGETGDRYWLWVNR